MKISREWLQVYFEKPLPEATELARALTFHAFEIESVDPAPATATEGDEVLDVKVTPNRGHDCLSYRGIAKEISAILKLPLKHDPFTGPLVLPIMDEMIELAPGTTSHSGGVSVAIQEPALCSRYIAAYIRNVKVGPSPAWLKKRLAAMGQQSINNIVDATNYVMFDLGQPLHAFDAAKLQEKDGFSIEVRKAKPGEKMTTLDSKECALTESMLMIADAHSGQVLGVAGVKGGVAAGITHETKDIILEAANFNGPSVRKTAQALKLRTDASVRFEQGLPSEIVAYAMKAVVELILGIANGTLVGFSDIYPERPKQRDILVSTGAINRVLGTGLSQEEVADTFQRLQFTYRTTDDTFTVTAPFDRLDLTIAEDLIEEVGRIIGYENIPSTPLPETAAAPAINTHFFWSERIRQWLLEKGFSEVYTSVFADEGERLVLNKVDGVRPYLRTSLIPSLTDALERNVLIRDAVASSRVRLFEIGAIWKDKKEILTVGLAVEALKKQPAAKDIVTDLLKEFDAKAVVRGSEAVVEFELDALGEAPHRSYPEAPVSATAHYETFSKYPYIVRDIALWVPKGMLAAEVLEVIRRHAGSLLVRSWQFDEFEKDGRVSYAFRLVFQSMDRTLFEDDANERMESIYAAMREKRWEVR